jgi:hypothetical protein
LLSSARLNSTRSRTRPSARKRSRIIDSWARKFINQRE